MKGAIDYIVQDRLPRLAHSVGRTLREFEEWTKRRWTEEALQKAHDELEKA